MATCPLMIIRTVYVTQGLYSIKSVVWFGRLACPNTKTARWEGVVKTCGRSSASACKEGLNCTKYELIFDTHNLRKLYIAYITIITYNHKASHGCYVLNI
jgi:hypothetical protein